MTEPLGALPHAFELRSFAPPDVPAAPPPIQPLDSRDVKWTAPLTRASHELMQLLNPKRLDPGRPIYSPGRSTDSPAVTQYETALRAQRESLQDAMRFQVQMHAANLTVMLALQTKSSFQKGINQLLNQQGG